VDAPVPPQQIAAQVQLGRASQGGAVALSARSFYVPRGQDWLLPRQGAAMSFLNGCGRALSAMAGYASKLIQLMGNYGMPTEGLRTHIRQAGFLQSDMTGRATVYHAEIRQPDLLNSALQMALQRNRVTSATN
jgi:hypothetical protein